MSRRDAARVLRFYQIPFSVPVFPMEQVAQQSFLDRLGGESVVSEWTRVFYESVAQDPVLAPLFPEDLTESREKQAAFFVEFLGGPARYSERYGQPFMRYRHRHVRIGQPERDAWMARVSEALLALVPDNPVHPGIPLR